MADKRRTPNGTPETNEAAGEGPGNAGISREVRVEISAAADIVAARQRGRALAIEAGFSATEATLIATAISELARNIVLYAKTGEVILGPVKNKYRTGIVIVARDQGPGIADLQRALMSGYSTSGGLGLGLPGVRRLVDEFDVQSERGSGTTVIATKWLR